MVLICGTTHPRHRAGALHGFAGKTYEPNILVFFGPKRAIR